MAESPKNSGKKHGIIGSLVAIGALSLYTALGDDGKKICVDTNHKVDAVVSKVEVNDATIDTKPHKKEQLPLLAQMDNTIDKLGNENELEYEQRLAKQTLTGDAKSAEIIIDIVKELKGKEFHKKLAELGLAKEYITIMNALNLREAINRISDDNLAEYADDWFKENRSAYESPWTSEQEAKTLDLHTAMYTDMLMKEIGLNFPNAEDEELLELYLGISEMTREDLKNTVKGFVDYVREQRGDPNMLQDILEKY